MELQVSDMQHCSFAAMDSLCYNLNSSVCNGIEGKCMLFGLTIYLDELMHQTVLSKKWMALQYWQVDQLVALPSPGIVVARVGVPVLQSQHHPAHHQRQHLVQGVHAPPLQPLGDGGGGLAEAKLGEDVVHPIRVQILGSPGQQPTTMSGREGIIENVFWRRLFVSTMNKLEVRVLLMKSKVIKNSRLFRFISFKWNKRINKFRLHQVAYSTEKKSKCTRHQNKAEGNT